jgi:O-acetyl-ADP-ribose deacetylase (regulator of RNase III)
MIKVVKMGKIELIWGDITEIKVDAIVNAANNSLLGGGGVDGAIHEVAGDELLTECEKLGGCETGDAKITKGYNLPAKYVIHTVGPIWRGGKNSEKELLSSCYRKSLELASKHGVKTIAFPNISTGVYGYPLQEAAEVALNEVNAYLVEHPEIEKVIFVAFSKANFDIYEKKLSNNLL